MSGPDHVISAGSPWSGKTKIEGRERIQEATLCPVKYE
jgi:hypothetical protein